MKKNNRLKKVKVSYRFKRYNKKFIYNKLNFKKTKKKSYRKYIYIFLFIFILILIITAILYLFFYDKYLKRIKLNEENIYCQEKFDPFDEAFNKAKDFIDKNIKGILINTEKISPSKKPKISVVIPCYNSKNYILRTIRSIQNQNYSDFEIVIVNDFSTDDTLSYIEQLQQEDPRINIIKNKKNMGILYTMAIGALSSKGKYIFPIDNDDMFLDKDVFSSVLNVAEKGNFDLVLFDIIISPLNPNVYETNYRKDFKKERVSNLVLFQPELSYFPIQPRNSNVDINLVEVILNGKCIKTKIYKKALNKLGEERYSRYMTVDADIILNYINFNTAKSMKLIPKYGYLFVDRQGSTSKIQFDEKVKIIYRIYMLDVLIETSKNTMKHKKILVGLLNYILLKTELKDALKTNEYIYKLFISCLDKIFNSKYISDDDKNEIRKNIKSLNFINYKF